MEKGLLIMEFAERIGANENTMTNWEGGKHIRKIKELIPKMARFFQQE